MYQILKTLVALVAITASAEGKPVKRAPPTHNVELLLGSSFGIPGRNATYDYIVVGGGTAGLVVATRLAEQQSGSVAVIEAGSFYEITNGNVSQIPATDGVYAGKGIDDWQPGVDWGYITTPQAVSFDLH